MTVSSSLRANPNALRSASCVSLMTVTCLGFLYGFLTLACLLLGLVICLQDLPRVCHAPFFMSRSVPASKERKREGERGGKREREKSEREREGGGKGTKEFKSGEGGTLCNETLCVRGGERLCQLCWKRQPVSS